MLPYPKHCPICRNYIKNLSIKKRIKRKPKGLFCEEKINVCLMHKNSINKTQNKIINITNLKKHIFSDNYKKYLNFILTINKNKYIYKIKHFILNREKIKRPFTMYLYHKENLKNYTIDELLYIYKIRNCVLSLNSNTSLNREEVIYLNIEIENEIKSSHILRD
jgi:hypothetical protein